MSRILVAEDSETIMLLLRKRLQLAGHTVVEAADGLEAVSGVESERPDLILLDAMMPRMSGIEALRKLRASGDSTPVIMVSAHREASEMRDVIEAGADAVVPKPIDWDQLLGEIERLTHADG